ncbi:hypothetical protein PspLS_00105 [Pyricularia sp. CBS 133598]|nr:hypothetical protein PspLS_00105 [Pyricularia sp. CBS 133598]
MDDKAAVTVALDKRDAQNPAKPQYDEVILVMTGAADRNKIAEGMRQYLIRAERHRPALSPDWRTRIRWFQTGGNVLGKVVAHERWYKDLQPQLRIPVATGEALAASVAHVDPTATVDVFQLAPCEDRDVWDFINAIPNINIYHLFFGYNSRQGSATEGMSTEASVKLAQRQSQFHATLQRRLQARHAHARVIFTQNKPTFDDPRAGSQDLNWCRRYFPEQDTTMSLWDPFWTSLIREANPFANSTVQLNSIPDDEDTFLRQVVASRLKDENTLRKPIYAMVESAAQNPAFKRKSPRLNESPRAQDRVKQILVPEFCKEPSPTLEMGDANHITAVLNYLDQEKSGGRGAGRLVHAVCDTRGTDPTQPPVVKMGTAPRGEGWVLTGCHIQQTRNGIESILRESERSRVF